MMMIMVHLHLQLLIQQHHLIVIQQIHYSVVLEVQIQQIHRLFDIIHQQQRQLLHHYLKCQIMIGKYGACVSVISLFYTSLNVILYHVNYICSFSLHLVVSNCFLFFLIVYIQYVLLKLRTDTIKRLTLLILCDFSPQIDCPFFTLIYATVVGREIQWVDIGHFALSKTGFAYPRKNENKQNFIYFFFLSYIYCLLVLCIFFAYFSNKSNK